MSFIDNKACLQAAGTTWMDIVIVALICAAVAGTVIYGIYRYFENEEEKRKKKKEEGQTAESSSVDSGQKRIAALQDKLLDFLKEQATLKDATGKVIGQKDFCSPESTAYRQALLALISAAEQGQAASEELTKAFMHEN